MNSKGVIFIILTADLLLLFLFLSGNGNIALLNPEGFIAERERNLITTHIFIMLLAAIPVFITLITIAVKYRAGNSKATYSPDWSTNIVMEIVLWTVPGIIVAILAVNTWFATHELDPFKSIRASSASLTIQVIALRWKWLFIYPEQNIATVNFIEFPEQTSIRFELTADAPMNSFWIPQLGGQMYAMAGMGTQLNLIANAPGEYRGSAAEMSGAGFAGMKFIAKASTKADFDSWVQTVKQSPDMLDFAQYSKLSQPSEYNPVAFYSLTDKNLYNEIIMKFASAPSQQMEIMK